jgi:hypothetical protein
MAWALVNAQSGGVEANYPGIRLLYYRRLRVDSVVGAVVILPLWFLRLGNSDPLMGSDSVADQGLFLFAGVLWIVSRGCPAPNRPWSQCSAWEDARRRPPSLWRDAVRTRIIVAIPGQE